MTYGELFEIAVKDLKLNKTDVEDYRPYGVNALKLWLKSGVDVVYHYDIFHKQPPVKPLDTSNPSEALEELERDIKGRVILAEDRQLKLCAIIKQALFEIQDIKSAEPSEAMKIFCRERTQGEFIDSFPTGNIYVGMTTEEFEVVEQTLLKSQEQEKELARYKKLEEQLGCPLDVLVRSMTSEIYYDIASGTGNVVGPYLVVNDDDMFVFDTMDGTDYIYLNDYGKTWWLEKDKSE